MVDRKASSLYTVMDGFLEAFLHEKDVSSPCLKSASDVLSDSVKNVTGG